MMHTYFYSFSQFIRMGHDAMFVWPAYGIVLMTLAIVYWRARKKHRQMLLRLRSL